MLPLFYLSMELLQWVMGFFGGDPDKAVVDANGKETFPLVPAAVGPYSVGFNIFNTAILFPFIGVFERVLSRIGHNVADDEEDFSMPLHLAPGLATQLKTAAPAVQQEMARFLGASRLMLLAAKGGDTKFKSVHDHQKALDSLNREMRSFTAATLSDRADAPADRIGSQSHRGGRLQLQPRRNALPDRPACRAPALYPTRARDHEGDPRHS
jgi:phosphate:Na+ symporter